MMFAPDSAPSVTPQTLLNRLVAQGDAPNFVLHNRVRETINANGEVTATAFEFSAECR